jgi:hypothetical protein
MDFLKSVLHHTLLLGNPLLMSRNSGSIHGQFLCMMLSIMVFRSMTSWLIWVQSPPRVTASYSTGHASLSVWMGGTFSCELNGVGGFSFTWI